MFGDAETISEQVFAQMLAVCVKGLQTTPPPGVRRSTKRALFACATLYKELVLAQTEAVDTPEKARLRAAALFFVTTLAVEAMRLPRTNS